MLENFRISCGQCVPINFIEIRWNYQYEIFNAFLCDIIYSVDIYKLLVNCSVKLLNASS